MKLGKEKLTFHIRIWGFHQHVFMFLLLYVATRDKRSNIVLDNYIISVQLEVSAETQP